MSLARLRKKLAKPEPSWQLCLLGIIGALLASFFIILFRFSFEWLQLLYLDSVDHYNTLTEIYRFFTPLIAVAFIILFSWLTGFKYSRMGIPFVIYRLKAAYGSIPLRNTLTQFFGGIFALAGGFSVGREGPAVHIGAASSSLIGSYLSLPKNAIRTLCACGIAAGISASFNTPLAAVIFVMEVILREYKLHIFVPVILASIIGSMMTHAFFGPFHEFEFFAYIVIDFWHYPLLIVFGICIGFLAKAFNSSLIGVLKIFHNQHMSKRLVLAALIMGLVGVLVPQSMGSGLSAISFMLEPDVGVWIIISVLIAKFVATTAILGLGVPGGIIGPTLGIGAVAGALMALFVNYIYGGGDFSGGTFTGGEFSGDYALMGMAAMLAATLNAPLAALLTIIELSNQLQLALPAMVVITSAYLTSSQFLKNRSIFLQQLEYQQLPYQLSPVEDVLQKHGVLSLIQENYQLIESDDKNQLRQQLMSMDSDLFLIARTPATQALHFVEREINLPLLEDDSQAVKISEMPAISSQATLSEAYFALQEKRDGAVYIYEKTNDNVIGLLTFEKVRSVLTKGKV